MAAPFYPPYANILTALGMHPYDSGDSALSRDTTMPDRWLAASSGSSMRRSTIQAAGRVTATGRPEEAWDSRSATDPASAACGNNGSSAVGLPPPAGRSEGDCYMSLMVYRTNLGDFKRDAAAALAVAP